MYQDNRKYVGFPDNEGGMTRREEFGVVDKMFPRSVGF